MYLAFIALFLISHGCRPEEGIVNGESRKIPAQPKITTLAEPAGTLSVPIGTDIPVRLEFPDTVTLDSVQLFLGGTKIYTLLAGTGFPEKGPVEALIPTDNCHTGRTGVRLRVYFRGGSAENQSAQATLLSDVVPVDYGYTLVKEYPHDAEAYTQGLEYVDGWLYEGTGNYGTSSLRKVRLETGEVVRVRNLDRSLFGEGITVVGNRIYQLTYKSQVGFIYDRETFEEISKIYYKNQEGWGLTHDGRELIMSDGTNVIYFLDPEMFTVNREIEVYTDKVPLDNLNELEFIDGKIWANRYYTDEIVIIDPETGKVEGRINLKGILKTSDRKPNTDVLNGIAWDREKGRIFVTGKRWPKLFEIHIRETS
jgi:glutamine cyclotransferase